MWAIIHWLYRCQGFFKFVFSEYILSLKRIWFPLLSRLEYKLHCNRRHAELKTFKNMFVLLDMLYSKISLNYRTQWPSIMKQQAVKSPFTDFLADLPVHGKWRLFGILSHLEFYSQISNNSKVIHICVIWGPSTMYNTYECMENINLKLFYLKNFKIWLINQRLYFMLLEAAWKAAHLTQVLYL